MIGHSIPEYIFIRISIVCLRLIAPLSIIYLIACYYRREWILSSWLAVYAFVEAVFYLFVYLPRSRFMQKVRHHHMPQNPFFSETQGEHIAKTLPPFRYILTYLTGSRTPSITVQRGTRSSLSEVLL